MKEISTEKRKRGRPRKNADQNVSIAASTVKRGRGRPPKAQTSVQMPINDPVLKKVDASDLLYKPINVWDNSDFNKNKILSFSEGYKAFMNKAKTEREFIKESIALAKEKGYKNLDELRPGLISNRTRFLNPPIWRFLKPTITAALRNTSG